MPGTTDSHRRHQHYAPLGSSMHTKRQGRLETQQRTLNIVGAIEQADGAILPAVFKRLEETFHTGPAALGWLGLIQMVCRSLSSPLWGMLADRSSRTRLLVFGCFLWGSMTVLVGTSGSFGQLTFWRAGCSVGLAVVAPVTQSMIADTVGAKDRGSAFGGLQLWGNIGGLMGMVIGSAYSHTTLFIFGMEVDCWRISHFFLGTLSILLGFYIRYGPLVDPRRRVLQKSVPPMLDVPKRFRRIARRDGCLQDLLGFVSRVFREVAAILKTPTVLVIMLQGAAGCLPWSAMSFGMLWFQYLGIPDLTSAILTATFMLGNAVGGRFGGWAGDRLESRLPLTGRTLLAQISVFAGIVFAYIILVAMDRSADNVVGYFIMMFLFGFSCSWTSPGCNRPMFTRITNPATRSTAFALLVAIDGVFASSGAPIVGYLSENVYGYKPVAKQVAEMTTLERATNANALGNALFGTLTYPWVLCGISYALLYWTYPRDLAHVKSLGYDHIDHDHANDEDDVEMSQPQTWS